MEKWVFGWSCDEYKKKNQFCAENILMIKENK